VLHEVLGHLSAQHHQKSFIYEGLFWPYKQVCEYLRQYH